MTRAPRHAGGSPGSPRSCRVTSTETGSIRKARTARPAAQAALDRRFPIDLDLISDLEIGKGGAAFARLDDARADVDRHLARLLIFAGLEHHLLLPGIYRLHRPADGRPLDRVLRVVAGVF